MFIKPESRLLRALFWLLVVVVPGGFLLLALLGADVAYRRLRQESVALNDAEAPPSDDTPKPESSAAEAVTACASVTPAPATTSERPSQTLVTQGACESIAPVSRVAA